MERREVESRPRNDQLDVPAAEAGLAVLLETCEGAVAEIACSVPASQVRALLVIDRAESLNLSRLARALGASASATSSLCDRMAAADLLTRQKVASHGEIMLFATESGRRLVRWVRGRRRTVLGHALQSMTPEGRAALARGLAEVAGGLWPVSSAGGAGSP